MKFPEKIYVSVTKDDIAQGLPVSCYRCPIARAFNRLGFTSASVSGSSAIVGAVRAERVRYHLPVSARLFQHEFDNDRRVKPFRFVAKLFESVR